MAIRVLGIPVTIISLGLSKIFMQQANDYYIEHRNSEIYYLNLVPSGYSFYNSLCATLFVQ